MVELNLQNFTSAVPIPAQGLRKPLGTCLIDQGVITQAQLNHALHLQSQQKAPLGEILVGEGWVSPQDVLHALSTQSGWQITDLEGITPSPDLCKLKPVEFWLAHNVIPWVRVGPLLLVATARPDRFATVSAQMQDCGYAIIPVLAASEQIDRTIARQFSEPLAQAAETRVDEAQSCRTWTPRSARRPCSGVDWPDRAVHDHSESWIDHSSSSGNQHADPVRGVAAIRCHGLRLTPMSAPICAA